MAYYDTEDMVRNIGQTQASAMSNLWKPTPAMMEAGAGMGGDGAMLQAGAGLGGNLDMFEMGPFGQALAGPMLQPDLGLNNDSAGVTAMRDLNDLRGSAEREANQYDMRKNMAAQRAFQKANEAQAAKTRTADPTTSPSSDTSGQTNSVYAGAFPHADMIKGYIPEDLRNDPELMKIIAAGSHAESGWDVNRIQHGGGGRGLFQFDVNGGMGTGLRNDQLLGEAGARYQASKIVPMYADWYRKRGQSGLSDPAQVASWVAAQAERPFDYQNAQSQARQNYVASYNKVGQTPQQPAPAGSGAPYQVNRTSQFGLGLSKQEADAFCGPAAALALTKFYGNNIPVEQVRAAASRVGWNAQKGMAGPASQVKLLQDLGLNATSARWNPGQAQELLRGGTPLIIDTPGHYFVADQFDPNRGYRVGTSGTDLRQGGEWMTPEQMAALSVAGAPREMIWKH